MGAGRKVGPLRCACVAETELPRDTQSARSRGRRRCESPGRRLRRLLEPGCSAAPGRHCLALLPSGPDAVRRLPVRGTWLSTLRAPAQTPDDSAPQAVLGPAIADCGFREPLAPRLARPGRTMVAHRRTLSSPGRVAQRESARLTRERSLVRSQPRPFAAQWPCRFRTVSWVRCARDAGNAHPVRTPVRTSSCSRYGP